MSFGIANFDSLPHNVKLAFEDLEAYVNTFLLKEHNPDGTHTLKSGTTTLEKQMSASGRWWKGPGAWLLDDPTSDTPNAAVLKQVRVEGGTYNNFTTQGMDDCVILDINPENSDVTLTGLQVRAGHIKRLMGIRNGDPGARLITLKHNNSGSLEPNRFRLPSSEDLVLAANQMAWLFWNVTSGTAPYGWYTFITPHQSGGLATSGGGIQAATITLTQAQFQSLATTPQPLVAAPGALKVAVPIQLIGEYNVTTAYTNTPNLQVNYGTGATNLLSVISTQANGIRNMFVNSTAANYGLNRDSVSVTNTALNLSLSADLTGAGAMSNIRFTLLYRVFDVYS